MQGRIRLNRRAFLIYSVLRALVVATLVLSAVQGKLESVLGCVLALVLFLMPGFFEEQFRIEIPPLFEVFIYGFIFAAEILGEINEFYTRIPGWDTMLHTLNGFLCAAVGFAMVDLLNRHSKRLNLSPFYLAVTAFCFSMTIGVCWEFIEFTIDQVLRMDMQKDFIVRSISSVTLDPAHAQTPYRINNITRTIIETADGQRVVVNGGYLDIGLLDTMKDLMVNFAGAIVFGVIGYYYVKNRDEKSFAARLMIRPLSDEEQLQVDEYLDEQQAIRDRRLEDRRQKVESVVQQGEQRYQELREQQKERRRQEEEEQLRWLTAAPEGQSPPAGRPSGKRNSRRARLRRQRLRDGGEER